MYARRKTAAVCGCGEGLRMTFKRKMRVGAALGSGGARGMAHLGALSALEEAGISFDVYAGTSAGSIVGALRARGYSCADIVELFSRLDYKNLLLSVAAAGTSRPALDLLRRLLGDCSISELKKPFAAVATDTADASEVVLKEGDAAEAVLASCSIPPLFRGRKIGGRALVDGAFVNAIPGDRARELGADFVIGVALSRAESYRIREFYTAGGERKMILQTGFDACDVLLEPDLSRFSPADVFGGMEMYEIGYACAAERAEEILEKLSRRKQRA